MILDDLNDKLDIDILNIRNNYVLTDIFNKYFDEEKHVPLLYLVLDTNTLDTDTCLIDVKLLLLEVEKNKYKK